MLIVNGALLALLAASLVACALVGPVAIDLKRALGDFFSPDAEILFRAFVAALIMFLNSIVDFYQAQGLLFWLMGSLSTRAYPTVAFIFAYVAAGFLWLWSQGLRLNLITLGEEAALQLGVEVASVE